MISARPAHTVAELVDGYKSSGRATEGNEAVDPVQKNPRIDGRATVLLSLPREAPVEIIDEPWSDDGSESDGQAFAVVQEVAGCALAGELLYTGLLKILHLPARKQGF